MPIYQYKCQKCFTIHEILQGINDPPLMECSSCQSPVKKIIAPAGIIFKGSGFHINDYRGGKDSAIGSSDKPNKPNKPNKESSSTNETSTEKAKDVKPSEASSTSTSTSASKETKNSAAA